MTKAKAKAGNATNGGTMAAPKWVKEGEAKATQDHRTGKRPWFAMKTGNAVMGTYKRREEFMFNNRQRVAYVLKLDYPTYCNIGKDRFDTVNAGEVINVGMTAALRCIEDIKEGTTILIKVMDKVKVDGGEGEMWECEVKSVPKRTYKIDG